MSDAGCPSELRPSGGGTEAQPRAIGHAAVAVTAEGGRTRLDRLAQQGSARCLLPRVAGPVQAVFLNTAGGITGGDRLGYEARAGAGAHLVATTQAAERIYRAQPGSTGRVVTRLSLGPGARLDWLPQETILFDRSALDRRLEVEMAADATLVAVEPLILGRTAMGETVEEARLADRWEVRRGGALVYVDALRLIGPLARIAARPGLFGAARAAASVLLVARDAEARLDPLRALLAGLGGAVRAGASAWNGLVALRLLAPDGAALRAALMPVLERLTGGPLPRVWTM